MNPDTFKALANLPWSLQIILGSGYCAYRLSYFGIRKSHKGMDEIFISISFGLISEAILLATSAWTIPMRMAAAFFTTLGAGLLWRVVGRGLLTWSFRKTGYSWADETESAWEKLQECKNRPTQLSVETDDGWSLYCTDAEKAGEMPLGPYILGTSGDLLMYVDASEGPEKGYTPVERVFDDKWGSLITYIPKERIKAIRIRYEPSTSPAVAAAPLKGWVEKLAAAMRLRREKAPEPE